ncbi:MAG: hypothetical protein ABI220_02310 [Candidatus Saccharimonadales bacterium]
MIKHAVIYIFGLGDHHSRGQKLAIGLAQPLHNVDIETFQMQWLQKQPYEARFTILLNRIDELSNRGYKVSLIGVSAGASVAVNALAARRRIIHRVVCICGKLRNPDTVHPDVYQKNPAFRESMDKLPISLSKLSQVDLSHILSIKPLADELVPPNDTILVGAKSKTIFSAEHSLSIALGITLYSQMIFGFIKRDD